LADWFESIKALKTLVILHSALFGTPFAKAGKFWRNWNKKTYEEI
jgi:hypothetical protein